MKWLRIILPILLIVGMLLCINSVAYAADPPDDGGLDVDIVIVGDDADVELGIDGDNPDVYLNGQNINEPTVIRHTSTRTVDKNARQLISELDALLGEYGGGLNLTANGLAKVIIQVQGQDSALSAMSQDLDEYTARLDDLADGQVAGLNDQFSYLSGRIWDLESRHNALATEVEDEQAAMLEKLDKMELDYNRKLLIMAGVFLAVVLGLGIGLTRSKGRKRIS